MSFFSIENEALICRAFRHILFNDAALRVVQKGADDHDLAVCVLYSCIVEPSGFLLVCAFTSLPEISVKALLAVAKQELLPLAVERIAELNRHVGD